MTFVCARKKESLILIGVGGSKDARARGYSSRIIVVVSDRVDAFSALVVPALVDWRERIKSLIYRNQSASSHFFGVSGGFPILYHSSTIGTKNVTGVLTHCSGRHSCCSEACRATLPTQIFE